MNPRVEGPYPLVTGVNVGTSAVKSSIIGSADGRTSCKGATGIIVELKTGAASPVLTIIDAEVEVVAGNGTWWPSNSGIGTAQTLAAGAATWNNAGAFSGGVGMDTRPGVVLCLYPLNGGASAPMVFGFDRFRLSMVAASASAAVTARAWVVYGFGQIRLVPYTVVV